MRPKHTTHFFCCVEKENNFNFSFQTYTQYIPLSIYDLQQWMGAPSIYVYDCSCAGLVVESFKTFANQHEREHEVCMYLCNLKQRYICVIYSYFNIHILTSFYSCSKIKFKSLKLIPHFFFFFTVPSSTV